MTVTVQRDALLAAVRKALGAVQTRNAIPILANVLIEVSGGLLRVTGTDLDLQIRAECEADGELATTLPADKLAAAVESLRPGKVSVEPISGRSALTIRQGRSTRTLPTLPADDFPQFSSRPADASFTVESAVLHRLIETTHVAQADDATRVYLNGIYLHVAGDHLRAVGLDGMRMIRTDAPLPDGASAMPGMIVPSRAIGLIRKLILGGEEPIEVEASKERIVLATPGMRIIAKLIDGTYPDYERITPGGGAHCISAVRSALVDALSSTVAVIEGDGKAKTRTAKVTAQPGAEPELSAQDAIGGGSIEPLPAEYDGDGSVFGVNARLLISIASAFREASTLRLELVSPSTPFRITSEAEPDMLAVSGTQRV